MKLMRPLRDETSSKKNIRQMKSNKSMIKIPKTRIVTIKMRKCKRTQRKKKRISPITQPGSALWMSHMT